MSICDTRRRRAWAGCLGVGVLALTFAGGAPAEELALRGRATFGARLYALQAPFGNDDLSGFFDQYRHIPNKQGGAGWFADVLDLRASLFRPDGTSLLRARRTSTGWLNQRGGLDLNWKGLSLGVDYARFRSDELRVFPRDTRGALPTLPVIFSTRFNPDTGTGNPLGRDRRLFVRRNRVGGEFAIRPEGFGRDLPWLRQIRFFAKHERRGGARQDRFLLDALREVGVGGSQTARFRASRRELDQEVTTLGGVLVASPGGWFTSLLKLSFERFRERAPVIHLGDLVAADPTIGGGFGTLANARGIRFVPGSDRLTASLELSRHLGGASFDAGISTTHLAQAGRRSPLQQLQALDAVDIDTTTAHAAARIPLGARLAVSGFFKFSRRENDFDREDFDRVAPGSTDATRGQVDPFLRRLSRFDSGLEIGATPVTGTWIGIGHRLSIVDRKLRFASAPGAILPAFDLRGARSEVHTLSLRARARFQHQIRISGELGYQWAPRVGFARDLESAVLFEGRVSGSLPLPIPVSISGFGRARNGKNDEITLTGQTPGRTLKKKFAQTLWSYGATLHARPLRSLSMFASFAQHRDRQAFPHIRSNLPRFVGPAGLAFFRDSRLGYASDVKTLVVGGRDRISKRVDASLSTSLGWVRAGFDRDTQAGSAIDGANRIASRIAGVDARIGAKLQPGLRLDLRYRFSGYLDRIDLDPLLLDERVHAVMLSASIDFERFRR